MPKSFVLRLTIIGFLSGVLFTHFCPGWYGVVIVFALAIVFFTVSGFYNVFFRAGILAAAFAFGSLRFMLNIPTFLPQDIAFYRDLDNQLEVTGVVSFEPDIRSDRQNILIRAVQVFDGHQEHEVSGNLLIKLQRFPQIAYGDVLRFKCKLKSPQKIDNFDYAAFLAEGDIYVYCSNPYVTIEKKGTGDFFWTAVYDLKFSMTSGINRLFPEPEASLVAGLLLGLRRTIPQPILDDFQHAGLTHVLAISGYNVNLMITVFGALLKGTSRRLRYGGMFGGILLLVFFTGFSASVIRAAIMGSIVLLAQASGRRSNGMNALLLSGALMVFSRPLMLIVDLSFQLSFLSTLGLLVFMPHLEKFTKRVSFLEKIPAFVREGALVTLAAQTFTTPLIIFQFGIFSLIAPVANIFTLPFVPWIMLFAFASLVILFFFQPFAVFLATVALVLLKMMLFVVSTMAHLPFAFLKII